jgi:long-chain fatty acid transport protein
MSFTARKAVAWLLAMGVLAFSGSALATNGYFTHGVGAQSKGMAGTGVGSNADMGTIMGASNPALTVFASDSWEAGISIFSPRRSFATTSSVNNGANGTFSIVSGSWDSSSEWFPIPYVAKSWKMANDNVLSFLFYGRGGMNTDWDNSDVSATSGICDPTGQAVLTGPGPFCAGKAGVDLSQAFLTVNYAGKTSDKFAWGIGPIIAIQLFEANGVASYTPFTQTFADAFATTGQPAPATALSNNGHDTSIGWGIAGGIWAGLSDSVSVGLAYQSKMTMGEFDDYADLFAEDGGFDIPSAIRAGISFVATDALRVNFDIEQVAYTDVDSVSNPLANIFSGCFIADPSLFPETSGCLGGANGGGFGWEDMTAYKLGFEWQKDERNTWRFGYSYGEQPIQSPDVVFNILAPGVMEQHITFGWTHQTANGGALTLSFMYAPEVKVTGPNVFDFSPAVPTNPPQTIELKMDQLEFEIAYRF